MIININGRVFSGRNVTVVNGKVTDGEVTGVLKNFDEWSIDDSHLVDNISINAAFADVNFLLSDSLNRISFPLSIELHNLYSLLIYPNTVDKYYILHLLFYIH